MLFGIVIKRNIKKQISNVENLSDYREKAQIGNNVSHSKHRTKRTFDVNLFKKKFYYVEENCWISLKISAAGLRLINKIGLDAALKQAVAKGYCDWSDIKVIGD